MSAMVRSLPVANDAEQGPLALAEDEVHLWIAEPEKIHGRELLEEYLSLLDGEERERHAAFAFHADRHRFLVAHALVRVVLSRYAGVAPAAWRFAASESGGRPELVNEGVLPLRWSLSHAHGMAICAVALAADVGADVEDVQQERRTREVADALFAPREAADLRALPAERERVRFFEYWTLKEAYLKARGVGLTIPLSDMAFTIRPGQPPRVSFSPQLGDRADAWHFVQLWLSPRHVSAVALRRSRELDLRVRCQHTVPLDSDGPPWFVSAASTRPTR